MTKVLNTENIINKYKINSLVSIENYINNTHPQNIVNKIGNININVFKVVIEYITSRNNKKQRELCFLINTYNPNYDFSNEVNEWYKNYNSKKNIHKQISNVAILESLCIGNISI